MRRALLVSMMLALALPGCGEDKKRSSGSVTLKSRQPVALDAHEYGFEPGTILIVTGGESAPVRFELRNRGSLPHDVHVRAGDKELGGTDAVGGGKRTSATVSLAPGQYEIYCSIGDHAELGMKGTLTVE